MIEFEPKRQRAYVIQAHLNGRQIPTFYLLANVQGIQNEREARGIAMDILLPLNRDSVDWNNSGISAVETTL